MTSTLTQERLIVGDTLRVKQSATVSADGNNLTGLVRFEVRIGTAGLAAQSTIATTLTTPANATSSATTGAIEAPLDIAAGIGEGTYAATADITIPAAKGNGRWGSELRGQTLDLDSVSWSFQQTR